MRTVTVNLFRFDELSPQAQDSAIEKLRGCDLFHWGDEWRASFQAFCDYFGVTLIEWSVGDDGCPWRTFSVSNENFRGMRLRDFDRDHMPTGFSGDCSFWYAFYDTFKETGDAKAAFYTGIDAGMDDWDRDIAHAYSDEGIREFIEANEYDFTEDGQLY
jgi:hypothetical protein